MGEYLPDWQKSPVYKKAHFLAKIGFFGLVCPAGIEPATQGFSVLCSHSSNIYHMSL